MTDIQRAGMFQAFWTEMREGKKWCLQFSTPDGVKSDSLRGGVAVENCVSVGDDLSRVAQPSRSAGLEREGVEHD